MSDDEPPWLAGPPARWAPLAAVAQAAGVAGVLVDGAYGLIAGGAGDSVILPAYARTGEWAPGLQRLLSGFFEERGPGVYVDVGANIGLTTIPLARDGRIAVHAFEPDPANFRWLVHNLGVHCRKGNVTAHQIAAFDRADTLDLALAADNFGDHHLAPRGRSQEGRTLTQVRADRLDAILDLAALPRPIAVKIDTQGAEPPVLLGAQALIAAADLVVFEYWPYGMARMGVDPAPIFEVIRQFDQGSVEPQEWAAASVPRPAADLVEELETVAADPNILNFRDVILRRA